MPRTSTGWAPFQIIGAGEETLPLVAFNLAEEQPYDEFDVAFQLHAERGWMVPAYNERSRREPRGPAIRHGY